MAMNHNTDSVSACERSPQIRRRVARSPNRVTENAPSSPGGRSSSRPASGRRSRFSLRRQGMSTLGVLAALVFFAVLVYVVTVGQTQSAENTIREANYEPVELTRNLIDRGPFAWWESGKGTQVYRVTARHKVTGQIRHGHVLVRGIWANKLAWDDEQP